MIWCAWNRSQINNREWCNSSNGSGNDFVPQYAIHGQPMFIKHHDATWFYEETMHQRVCSILYFVWVPWLWSGNSMIHEWQGLNWSPPNRQKYKKARTVCLYLGVYRTFHLIRCVQYIFFFNLQWAILVSCLYIYTKCMCVTRYLPMHLLLNRGDLWLGYRSKAVIICTDRGWIFDSSVTCHSDLSRKRAGNVPTSEARHIFVGNIHGITLLIYNRHNLSH